MSSIDSATSSLLAAQQSSISSQIAYAVEAKRLDAARQQGDAATKLLEEAVQLSKAIAAGNNFDAIG